MPRRAPTACPKCKRPKPAKLRYCDPCRAVLNARRIAKLRELDRDRPSASARGYGAAWRKKRARFLAANPFCFECGRKGTIVDHRIPRAIGGSDDESNLQTLCKPDHDRKTAKEKRWIRKRSKS